MYNVLFILTTYSFFSPIKYYNNPLILKNKNKNNYNYNFIPFMKFEEIDGDYDSDGNLINKTLQNNAFENIDNIEYDTEKDMWIIDLNTGDSKYLSDETINFHMEKEINITNENDENFPSFYKFLREREIKEIKEKGEYLKKANENQKLLKEAKEKYDNIEPTSKDLKLLSSFSTAEWMKTWLYEMIHVPDYFPTFMYQDMFRMREFSQKNNTKHYFYIGYFPTNVNLKHGPFYIGAFELVPAKREFLTHIIIQNPYHCAERTYDTQKIKDFKKELLAMCNDSLVFFKFSNLKDTSDQRYFYSWLYEE